MNTIENMWSEVKRTMQETWPVLPPRKSDELWTLVSDAWDEVLHRIEGQLDGLHYQHILQNVMVPSVRMLYSAGIIHLQQDHPSIHDYQVVQEWLSRQADVEPLD